jgi:hypothetical protein
MTRVRVLQVRLRRFRFRVGSGPRRPRHWVDDTGVSELLTGALYGTTERIGRFRSTSKRLLAVPTKDLSKSSTGRAIYHSFQFRRDFCNNLLTCK